MKVISFSRKGYLWFQGDLFGDFSSVWADISYQSPYTHRYSLKDHIYDYGNVINPFPDEKFEIEVDTVYG